MSALTQFRDHCRREAARPHIVNRDAAGVVTSTSGPSTAERALWTQLADEIDEYLARPALVDDLFGEAATEPEDEPA